LEDKAHPFATINDALTAIDARRGAITSTPWRVVVQPGAYSEGSIVSRANVDIIGSGRLVTQLAVSFIMVGTGPFALADMSITIAGSNPSPITVDSTLITRNVAFSFVVPSSLTSLRAFLMGAGGSEPPVLRMYDTSVQMQGTPLLTLVVLQGTNGTGTVEFRADNLRCSMVGALPTIVNIATATGTSIVHIQNSSFDIAASPSDGNVGLLYGSSNIGRTATFDFLWSIVNCTHTITNASSSPPYCAVYFASALALPHAITQVLVQGCLFDFVGFAEGTAICAGANINFTTDNFIQMVDDVWVGMTTSTGNPSLALATTFMPRAASGSVPIIDEGISPSGSMVTTGGLQTDGTVLPNASFSGTVYPVVDGDCIIVWAPTAASTLVLPNNNNIFTGKWIYLFNTGTGTSDTITLNAQGGGTANGVVVNAGDRALVISLDGSVWMSLV